MEDRYRHKSFTGFRLTVAVILAVMTSIPATAQVIGDSVASIVNKWKVGDYVSYRNYSGRIRIEGRDTITEREAPETITKVLLKEVLPNDDKVFVISTQSVEPTETVNDNAGHPLQDLSSEEAYQSKDNTAIDKEELNALFLKLNEVPVTMLTDFSGEVKDIFDYDSLRTQMDSCFSRLIEIMNTMDLPEEIRQTLTQSMEATWEESVSKESLMSRSDFFKYYGYNYPLGTMTEQSKLPLATGEYGIDATVSFSCDDLEDENGNPLIAITSVTTYDSVQVMDSLLSSMVGEKALALREPDGPHTTFYITEQYLFEPESGTLISIVRKKQAISPDKSTIDYSIYELE